MPKTDFNQIYLKTAGAGFVGVKAMVRTPSRSEVLASVTSYLLGLFRDALDGNSTLYPEGKEFIKSLPSKPWNVQFEELANSLYFEPCMMGCGDPNCREWVDVYGLGGETFCHVSECQLEPFEQAPDDEPEPVGEISIKDFIKGRMDAVNKGIIVKSVQPVCNMPDEAQGIYYRGYATALADILSIISGGDVLKDV